MGITVGVLGAGGFGMAFVPLFKAHPLVDRVYAAEKLPERRERLATHPAVDRVFESFEQLCDSDADAIAVFTQRWTHGPLSAAALRAGKHVYSSVPAAVTMAELTELVRTVERTGLTYMLGETSYYYPSNVFCREKFRRGEFGRFVYGEGEYLHDMSHGFYEPFSGSNGPDWKRFASFPPMLYPSHSVSMVLAVTGARMVSVSCLGFTDHHEDGIFVPALSRWGNAFSNESALFQTSDGGMARINEFRRVGHSGGASVRCSIYGTEASYEEQSNARVWVTRAKEMTDVSSLMACAPIEKPGDWDSRRRDGVQEDFFGGLAPVHPRGRLPREYNGLPNGHYGSHQFLVDDFLTGCARGTIPPNHVWQAARYCAPGIVAHESAIQGGARLEVPDLGGPPAGAELSDERGEVRL
jgi:predicted dehydrogenase